MTTRLWRRGVDRRPSKALDTKPKKMKKKDGMPGRGYAGRGQGAVYLDQRHIRPLRPGVSSNLGTGCRFTLQTSLGLLRPWGDYSTLAYHRTYSDGAQVLGYLTRALTRTAAIRAG
ncbi:hypothetical protein PIIN_08966 [Serendipita indica DSM 11827]|uniref:Uncharacterized protein n=1 Tax=Serendipita indica (strain DSM 11827) TaxID=1109443 RepID=G4TUJ3_SERID|nr:hypothetical protein PIIN_08966 [Serendipita indica DSM 11827]